MRLHTRYVGVILKKNTCFFSYKGISKTR